jgi:hypothetical protein
MVACRDDQILILHGHVDDSLFEIEFWIHFVDKVNNLNFIILS